MALLVGMLIFIIMDWTWGTPVVMPGGNLCTPIQDAMKGYCHPPWLRLLPICLVESTSHMSLWIGELDLDGFLLTFMGNAVFACILDPYHGSTMCAHYCTEK